MSVTIDGTGGVTIPTGGLLTGVGSDSLTTFLVGNVALTNAATWYSGPNTGSIGAAGQKWLIIANGCVTNTGSGSSQGVRIYNGSAEVAVAYTRNQTASGYATTSCFAVVTLAAATTFTLQARDFGGGGSLQSDGSDLTSITAVRLS